MTNIWRTIRGYILWSHERGTIQYDVMVTLILLFIFLSPLWINFKDKPVERNPHQTGVVVIPDSGRRIDLSDRSFRGFGESQRSKRVAEPVAGNHRAHLRRSKHHQG